MTTPKHSSMAFYSRLREIYPEIFSATEDMLDVSEYEPDTTSLTEPKPDYNPEAMADLVIRDVILYDDKDRKKQDIVVKSNVISLIGSADQVKPLISEDTAIIEADGRTVLPGFCDSHLHLLSAAQRQDECGLEDIKTQEDLKDRLSEFSEKNSDVPVIYAYGLNYTDPPLIPAENARRFLDGIVEDRAIFISAHDLHTGWANTKAIEKAGLLHKMPPFPELLKELNLDENIVLGEDRIPAGEFREPETYFLIEGPLRSAYPESIEKKLSDIEMSCHELAQSGFTSVHRMGLSHPVEDLSFLLMIIELEQQGRLPLRIYSSISAVSDRKMMEDIGLAHRAQKSIRQAQCQEINAAQLHDILSDLLEEAGRQRHDILRDLTHRKGDEHPVLHTITEGLQMIYEVAHATHIRPHLERVNPHESEEFPEYIIPDCKFRCDTIKIFMDGVIEKDTAFRFDQKPGVGIPEFSQSELNSFIMLADRLGMQVAAHSIGDASVRSMLDAISIAREKNRCIDERRGHRIPHRIEHIELCSPSDIERFGKEHVIASMQPLHERPPVRLWHKKVPEEKWDTAFAWRDLTDGGAVLVFGSDWPIVSCDVLKGAHHATGRTPWTKEGRDQSISINQAFDAYTKNAAFTEYASGCRGTVAPGMLADLVVLSGDPAETDEQNTDSTEIFLTVCNGKVTYNSESENNG